MNKIMVTNKPFFKSIERPGNIFFFVSLSTIYDGRRYSIDTVVHYNLNKKYYHVSPGERNIMKLEERMFLIRTGYIVDVLKILSNYSILKYYEHGIMI